MLQVTNASFCFPGLLIVENVLLNSTASSLAVFDREAVLDLVDGERELLEDLADMFREDLPRNVERVENAISVGDTRIIHDVAHQLKSSVGNLGGRAAQNAVQQLEQTARDGQLENSRELFSECRLELDRFCQALDAFLSE